MVGSCGDHEAVPIPLSGSYPESLIPTVTRQYNTANRSGTFVSESSSQLAMQYAA